MVLQIALGIVLGFVFLGLIALLISFTVNYSKVVRNILIGIVLLGILAIIMLALFSYWHKLEINQKQPIYTALGFLIFFYLRKGYRLLIKKSDLQK